MRARVQDKSSAAVIARVKVLFDDTNRLLDEHDARMAQEERRAKLVFPDPDTVGLNLPEHLVGDSEDYMTKKRAHGTNKDGFTRPEVSHTTHTSTHTNTNKQAFALAFGYKY